MKHRFLIALIAKLAALLFCLSGCTSSDSTPTPAPEQFDGGTILSIIAVVDVAEETDVPDLPDDFSKKQGDVPKVQTIPEPPKPPEVVPDPPNQTGGLEERTRGGSGVSKSEPPVLRTVFTMYCLKKGCPPCVKGKADTAVAERVTNGAVSFVIVDDESQFPQWIRDIVKANAKLPPNKKLGFPFIEWTNENGWFRDSGWTSLKDFMGHWANTIVPPPVHAAPPQMAAPPQHGPLMYNSRQHRGHWDWPGDLRFHLKQPPHNYSPGSIDAMPDSQVIQTHDVWHNRYGAIEHKRTMLTVSRACPT